MSYYSEQHDINELFSSEVFDSRIALYSDELRTYFSGVCDCSDISTTMTTTYPQTIPSADNNAYSSSSGPVAHANVWINLT